MYTVQHVLCDTGSAPELCLALKCQHSKQLCCTEAAMESASMFDVMLYNSAVIGNLEGAKAALANGGRVGWRSPQGLTPLLAAARDGHSNICVLLLQAGSNVNETTLGAGCLRHSVKMSLGFRPAEPRN